VGVGEAQAAIRKARRPSINIYSDRNLIAAFLKTSGRYREGARFNYSLSMKIESQERRTGGQLSILDPPKSTISPDAY
jgi:hypothetical protein